MLFENPHCAKCKHEILAPAFIETHSQSRGKARVQFYDIACWEKVLEASTPLGPCAVCGVNAYYRCQHCREVLCSRHLPRDRHTCIPMDGSL